MKSLSLEEENIIKDIRNILRLKKELNYTVVNYTEVSPYLKYIINNRKKSDMWKIKLAIANCFRLI